MIRNRHETRQRSEATDLCSDRQQMLDLALASIYACATDHRTTPSSVEAPSRGPGAHTVGHPTPPSETIGANLR